MSARVRAGEESDSEREDDDSVGPADAPAAATDSTDGSSTGGAAAADGGSAAAGAAEAVDSVASTLFANSLLAVMKPSISSMSDRLVELQEAQQILVHTLGVQRAEISESNTDLSNARAILARIPEYQAKVARLKRAMAAAEALVVKTEKGAAALRHKLETKDRERAAKRSADASGYSSVSAR